MQTELKEPRALFDEEGNLTVRGYAKRNFFTYNKEKLQTSPWRLKEWDYYYVGNDDYALALTIADNGYMALLSLSFLDFRQKKQITKSDMKWFTKGKTNLPPSSRSGDVSLQSKNGYLIFKNDGKIRVLKGYYDNFDGAKKLEIDLTLYDEPEESMTILTPFGKEKHFYYNQKINCMTAKGSFNIGKEKFVFNPKDSFGTLDWGRGVWTYKNTWYWGSLSTRVDGKLFGFNIGYGFGDTSAATENVIFYDGKTHKFANIDFGIPLKNGKEDYLAPWTLKSDDDRLNMTFEPILDRASDTNALIIRSDQHQVFGRFSGVAVLDDGRKIKFRDKLGFAEKVFNKW